MNKFLIALLFLPSISNADGFVDKIVEKLASMNKIGRASCRERV